MLEGLRLFRLLCYDNKGYEYSFYQQAIDMQTLDYVLDEPTQNDAKLAFESSHQLSRIFERLGSTIEISVAADGEPELKLAIPKQALKALTQILANMANGNAIMLMPVHAALTTQEAADILNISRPYLIKLIEAGMIPHTMVGTHRRVLFKDLMEYKRKNDEQRLSALQEMTALAEEHGLYDCDDLRTN